MVRARSSSTTIESLPEPCLDEAILHCVQFGQTACLVKSRALRFGHRQDYEQANKRPNEQVVDLMRGIQQDR